MVRPAYFQSKTDYLTQKEWSKLWQKAMKLDYSPVVDIRTVKTKGKTDYTSFEKESLKKAILETAKYPVKPFDLERDKNGKVMPLTEVEKLRITEDMMNGLYRKRQIGFGKLFKTIKKELQLDDVEEGNLIQTGEEETKSSSSKNVIAIWNWLRKNYFIR